jgi:hypothetical protein
MLEKKTKIKKILGREEQNWKGKIKIKRIMIFVGAVVKIKSRPSGIVCGDIFVVCVLD